jgi:para-nitrobenzyl esterase
VHSTEIEYALGNLDTNDVYAWTEEDHAISERMQGYFANFVKTGDPNGEGLPPWPTYASGQRLVIDVETRAEADRWSARYRYLQSLAR